MYHFWQLIISSIFISCSPRDEPKFHLNVCVQNTAWYVGNKLFASRNPKINLAIYVIIPRNGVDDSWEKGWKCGPKGDSVYFTVLAAFQLADWRGGGTSQLSNTHRVRERERRGGNGGCKKRQGCGCGVGERLRDYWTPVYFVDIATGTFFIVSQLSLSHGLSLDLPLLSPLSSLFPSWGYKSTLRRYGLKPRSVRRSIC